MSFDSTIGGASSSSYVTILYADDYFDYRLHSELWTEDIEKEKALVTATRMMERYVAWNISPLTVLQALTFPDNISKIIPESIKSATCELAYFILTEDRTKESDLMGFSSLKVGSLSLKVDPTSQKNPIPDSIFKIIRHLGTPICSGAFVELGRG